MTLREKIVQEIRMQGPMPFSRYMEICLYDSELGYYSRNAEQFGKAGDYYTSSDVHAVFGRLLARQFEEMWRVLGSPARIEIVELGPGRGLFARDVLDWCAKKFPAFFEAMHYTLRERSLALREALRKRLGEHIRPGKVTIQGPVVPDGKPEVLKDPTIVFANEFFDAFSVDVFSCEGALYISEENGQFVEAWQPASAVQVKFLEEYGIQPERGERVEVGVSAFNQMQEIARCVHAGFVVAIDYGYTRSELLAGRQHGTVTAYRQHSISASPYEAPGEQDITAHVNFTALAAGAQQFGMQAQPLVTQAQFLMGIGEQTQFADAFESCRLPQEHAKVALQLKHLVTPAGMGETFRVLICSRGVEPSDVGSLRGLCFSRP